MIAFDDYASIRRNYCVAYLGDDREALIGLFRARTAIESKLDVKLFICCRDDLAPDAERVIPVSKLKAARPNLAYIREVGFMGTTPPAETLLRECGVRLGKPG